MDENKGIKHKTSDIGKIFNQETRLDLKEIQDHQGAQNEIKKLEEARLSDKEKETQKYQKNYAVLINEEASTIYNKHYGHQKLEHPKPNWATPITWQDCTRKATENVEFKFKGRLEHIRQENLNQQKQVIEDVRFKRQILNKEVADIQSTTHRQRMDAYRDFEANKDQHLKDAINCGSKNPERDIYTKYKQQDSELLSKKDHSLSQAYQNHGFNYDNEQHALSKRFNMSM